ncbi:MAG: hypothetical protein OXI15_00240 [Chromatiales bacterium]|nr:hypothetical protein [Chromatiales bacterium]
MKTRNVVATAALIALGVEVQCGEAPGFERVALDMPHRETVVRGAIWYPAGAGGEVRQVGENAVFIGVPVLEGAAAAEGRPPVILLSHGLGGRFETNAWLSAGLAARGAIVLSVNHPKSTSSDFDLRQALNHWTRAQDLQGALDWLLDEPHWMPRVDGTRVAAVGYSYGGWTVLSMGGAMGNLAGLVAYCDSFGERDDVCRLLARAGIDLAAMDADRFNASYKDGRIKAIAAIDPGLHYGLDASNVTNLVDDVLLIGLGTGADRQRLLVSAAPCSQPASGTGAPLHRLPDLQAQRRSNLERGRRRPRLRRSGGNGPRCGSPPDPAGDFGPSGS